MFYFFVEQNSGTWKPQASQNECGNSLPPNPFSVRVIGGLNTEFGDYPFVALLGKIFLEIYVNKIH